jgi:hypothetical protein
MTISAASSSTTTATATRPKRRPSYINLSNTGFPTNNNGMLANDVLSPRTPRSISKSRRSSVVAEHVQEVIQSESSRHGSLTTLNGPPLLSDSTNCYFQDLASQDDEVVRSETPTLKARPSSEDLKNRYSSTATVRRTRSSSISSLLSTPVMHSFDVHTLYKIKTIRSSRKLDHFFGEFAPHDICIKEIRKEGLKAILQSKAPLCYFLSHLLEEYSSENLV